MGVISGLTKEIAPPIYGALNRIIQKARDMGFGDKIYYHSTTAKKDFDEFSDVGTGSNDLGYHFGTSQAASERNNNLINNKLRIYPVPDGVSPEKFWFRFSVEEDAFSSGSSDVGMLGVNNMNTLPFENIPFESINSMGQQWIRKYSLALSKETLGQVRGKFGGSIPIPGDNVTLNADALLSQAATEQQALKEELNKQLDEMLYSKLAETEKNMTDNTDAIVKKVPMKIFVG